MRSLKCEKTADRWYNVRVIEVDKQMVIAGGHTESNLSKRAVKQPGRVEIEVVALQVCLKQGVVYSGTRLLSTKDLQSYA